MAKRKPKIEYDILSLKLTDYSACIDAGINYEVRDPKHYDEEALVYKFASRLALQCRCTWPEERAGCEYRLTLYGEYPNLERFRMTLDDCHVRDEFGSKRYRKKRGEEVPVYQVPKGIGYLQKVRGSTDWSGTVWLSAESVTQMLAILPNVQPLYVSIHERLEGRRRSIVGLTLQTTDPAED